MNGIAKRKTVDDNFWSCVLGLCLSRERSHAEYRNTARRRSERNETTFSNMPMKYIPKAGSRIGTRRMIRYNDITRKVSEDSRGASNQIFLTSFGDLRVFTKESNIPFTSSNTSIKPPVSSPAMIIHTWYLGLKSKVLESPIRSKNPRIIMMVLE